MAVREVVDTGGDIPCLRDDSKPEWWFSDDEREQNRARERCRVCPVQRLCRRHAIVEEEHGIWAAETRVERNIAQLTIVTVVCVDAVASGQ